MKNFNKELIRRYRDNKATEEELEVFFQLIKEGKIEIELAELMDEDVLQKEDNGLIIPLYKKGWFKLAAACIILMLGIGSYLFFNNTADKPEIAESNLSKDVEAPKNTRAMITLSNGQKVYLDSAANGELAMQSNVKLVKLASGEIVYQTATVETVNEIQYNTLSNPRGSKAVSLALNDGTKVWLNSESSLKYPVAFVGNERKVEITGEAYFEVAKDASKPFKVNVAGKGEVEVLGTHFNINSYNDEATINTTLLEGSVKITPLKDSRLSTPDSRLLSPGQQAQLNSNGQININKNPDVEEVMAWKNGQFIFTSDDIETIMRQVSRWYDVDVVYEGIKSNETFSGVVSRNSNASQVLKAMEASGIKFRIEGKRIIVE